ncbi:MAG: ATP-binding cassette domain-containing protein, partial [Desulfosarcina sp.]|nr:ATP-binding cassette domain-containing protein [Desulfobacterales bacterium]
MGFIRRGPQGDEIPVLEEIEVGFPAGQIAWVSGPTGAGKSTLLHLLAGLLRPTRGVIIADGQP